MDKDSILKNTIVEPELKELISSGYWRNASFYQEAFAGRVFKFPDPPMSLIAPIFLQEGEVPIHNFLEAFLLEDFPYGLAAIPSDPTYVHGGTMAAPGLFYSHDLLHWPVFVRLVSKFPERWKRLRHALKELYIKNTQQDPVLNYFIFMILHEGALDDQFAQKANNNKVDEDMLFLLEQIYGEMKNRFDYHRSFLKNFFLAKLQDIISKPFKLYAVDEIDEQRLDVLNYERISPDSYNVNAVLMSHNQKTMQVNCTVIVNKTEDVYFSACAIKDIDVSYISSELASQEGIIIKKFLGEITVKNPRYFFYIDVKDHLKMLNRLTNFQFVEDPYNNFLPWVQNEIQRLIKVYFPEQLR